VSTCSVYLFVEALTSSSFQMEETVRKVSKKSKTNDTKKQIAANKADALWKDTWNNLDYHEGKIFRCTYLVLQKTPV
jgi:hypothetical protein